ncbi:MAG: hypothetical protein AABY15_01725 [Nanoarchaeota archaeon]
MVKLTQKKISKIAFEFTDKSGRRCGSVFSASHENDGKKITSWLLNPSIPISKKFHKDKLYICETPKIAKERLEKELNDWLKKLKKDI